MKSPVRNDRAFLLFSVQRSGNLPKMIGGVMKLAVVGRGMIGSAATRYLAEAGYDVTLIGTGEPARYSTHQGVFASHYDEGRITRGLDPVPFWSNASRASIARYRGLEAKTGIRFYHEVGLLMSGLEGGQGLIGDVAEVARRADLTCDYLRGADLNSRFPYFAFPDGTLGLHERTNAGYINPRRLVEAQLNAAKTAGAKFITSEVLGIDENAKRVRVDLVGAQEDYDAVLLATGGFTQGLLGGQVPLTVYARTVALFPLDKAEQARLAGMPSHISLPEDGRDPYLLPPILYPDGQVYLKLGGDPQDVVLEAAYDVKDWFRSGGSDAVGAFLEDEIRARIPALNCGPRKILPCVTTFTQDELPVIEKVGSRITVAVGGNGKAAKNSDELGRLAAEALTGRAIG